MMTTAKAMQHLDDEFDEFDEFEHFVLRRRLELPQPCSVFGMMD